MTSIGDWVVFLILFGGPLLAVLVFLLVEVLSDVVQR